MYILELIAIVQEPKKLVAYLLLYLFCCIIVFESGMLAYWTVIWLNLSSTSLWVLYKILTTDNVLANNTINVLLFELKLK